MFFKKWTKSIKGVDDIELDIPRGSPLVYHCTAPVSGKAKGVVFLIPDFNDEADGEAFGTLRTLLAEQYGLLAVTVEYHCYRSRLKDGARLDLNDEEFAVLRELCASHAIALLDRDYLIPALKQLPKPYEFEFKVTPANGEYQNFGFMQALDHLAVLHDLMQDGDPPCDFDRRNILAMGVGHGGYLAHLIAKFAPNALRAIFDADSRTSLPLSYLFGEQAGNGAPYYYHLGKIRIFPIIQTSWRQEPSADSYLTKERAEIRDVAFPGHISSMRLASQTSARACHYRMMTSSVCDENIVKQKLRQATVLQQSGFDVELRQKPTQDISALEDNQALNELVEMFMVCYPVLPTLTEPRVFWQSCVSYLSGDLLYCIDFDEFGCQAMIVPVERERKRFNYY